MVEMHYPLDDDREAFNGFYHKHISMLLTIDGFISAQRYECTHEARSPFLAVYRLSDPDVMTSEGYTSRAGRDSVDPVFKAKMTNWDRNLVTGDIENMDLADGGWMVLIDRLSKDSSPLPGGFTSLSIVGLDATIVERGVMIGQDGSPPKMSDMENCIIRCFCPVHAPRRSG